MITVVLPAARTLYSLTMTSLSMCTPLNTHTHIIRVVGQKFSVFKLVCAYLGGRGIVCKLISLKKRGKKLTAARAQDLTGPTNTFLVFKIVYLPVQTPPFRHLAVQVKSLQSDPLKY